MNNRFTWRDTTDQTDALLTRFKVGVLLALTSIAVSSGQDLRTLYVFQGGTDGYAPDASLVSDSTGVLYGNTEYGGGGTAPVCGRLGCGTVFSWSPIYGESVLHRFQGDTDGAIPTGGLTLGPEGSLYGVTALGGGSGCAGNGCGTVFALYPPTTTGGSRRYQRIYTFQGGSDGASPTGYLFQGGTGVLYGLTAKGGGLGCSGFGCGTFFKLVPPTGEGGAWAEKVLYSFQGGQDGSAPNFGLVPAGGGRFYGVTANGGGEGCGGAGCGTVFKLIPPGASGDVWNERTIYSFQGQAANDGAYPGGAPIVGSNGVLYGVTGAGGGSGCAPQFGCGVVYSLTPPTNAGSAWQESILYEFIPEWFEPGGALILDTSGSLYGVTKAGYGTYGMVFELSPPIAGGGWTETLLHSFTGGSDGGLLEGGLLSTGGILYGTTAVGLPPCQCGTIYSLTP